MTMVERVTEAIIKRGTTDVSPSEARAIARAVIVAMREPDAKMKTAGMRNMVSWQVALTGSGDASQASAGLVYSAMIDAALSEGDG